MDLLSVSQAEGFLLGEGYIELVQVSKCVNSSGSSETVATTAAATSRSFTLRVLEAILRIFRADSWLQRFWAMITPTATSIVVLDSIAVVRCFRSSVSCVTRTARRKALDTCAA